MICKRRANLFAMLMWVLIVGSILAAGASSGGDEAVEEIRRAIQAAGAKWSAGVTAVSRLSSEEKKALFGDPEKPVPEACDLVAPATVAGTVRRWSAGDDCLLVGKAMGVLSTGHWDILVLLMHWGRRPPQGGEDMPRCIGKKIPTSVFLREVTVDYRSGLPLASSAGVE